MQRKNFGKVMRYLVAICVLVSAFAMFACGGSDNNTGTVKNVNATVPLNSNNAAIIQSLTFSFTSGQVFGGNIGNGPVTLSFPTLSTFTLTTSGGATTSGTVTYNSGTCNFAGTGGGFATAETCSLLVNASNVTVGKGFVSGTITLVLSSTINGIIVTVNSTPLTAQVFIDSSDELFVVNPATNASVATGVNP